MCAQSTVPRRPLTVPPQLAICRGPGAGASREEPVSTAAGAGSLVPDAHAELRLRDSARPRPCPARSSLSVHGRARGGRLCTAGEPQPCALATPAPGSERRRGRAGLAARSLPDPPLRRAALGGSQSPTRGARVAEPAATFAGGGGAGGAAVQRTRPGLAPLPPSPARALSRRGRYPSATARCGRGGGDCASVTAPLTLPASVTSRAARSSNQPARAAASAVAAAAQPGLPPRLPRAAAAAAAAAAATAIPLRLGREPRPPSPSPLAHATLRPRAPPRARPAPSPSSSSSPATTARGPPSTAAAAAAPAAASPPPSQACPVQRPPAPRRGAAHGRGGGGAAAMGRGRGVPPPLAHAAPRHPLLHPPRHQPGHAGHIAPLPARSRRPRCCRLSPSLTLPSPLPPPASLWRASPACPSPRRRCTPSTPPPPPRTSRSRRPG